MARDSVHRIASHHLIASHRASHRIMVVLQQDLSKIPNGNVCVWLLSICRCCLHYFLPEFARVRTPPPTRSRANSYGTIVLICSPWQHPGESPTGLSIDTLHEGGGRAYQVYMFNTRARSVSRSLQSSFSNQKHNNNCLPLPTCGFWCGRQAATKAQLPRVHVCLIAPRFF